LTNDGSWKKILRFRILALLVGRHQLNFCLSIDQVNIREGEPAGRNIMLQTIYEDLHASFC